MIGQSVGSDASRLSCFLFRPRKSRERRRKRSHTNVSNASVTRTSTPPAQTPQRSFRGTAAGTHLPSPTGSHTADHRAKQGRFGRGWYHYPRIVLRGSKTLRGRVSERQTLPLLGLGRVCSRRTQKAFGTAMRMMRVAVPRRRGPAGLRDLFRFCRNRDLYIRRSWFSACARQGRYHYPRCAPRAAETLGGRLSKRLICRFLRSGGHH